MEVKPKRQKVSTQASRNVSTEFKAQVDIEDENRPIIQNKADNELTNPIKSLLAAYESSDDDDEEQVVC